MLNKIDRELIMMIKKNSLFFVTLMMILIFLVLISCENTKKITKKKNSINISSTPKQKRSYNILINKKKISSNTISGGDINWNNNDSLALENYDNYVLNYEKIEGLNYLSEYNSKYNKSGRNTLLSDSIRIILANENFKVRRLDESLKYYRKLINKNDEFKRKYNVKLFSIITEKEKALEIYNSGLEYFNKQEFDKALSKFKTALKKQSDLKRAIYRKHVTQGLIYLSKRDKKLVKAAIENFEKAISISPEIGETYYYNAIACLKKNSPDIEKARYYFLTSLKSELTEKMKIKIASKFEEFKIKFDRKKLDK